MFEKTQVILIYAMVGISIALWPILLRFIPARFQTSSGSAKFTRAPAVVANVFGAILIATPLLIAFSSITTSPLLALTGICALIALTLAFHQGQLKLMTAIYIFAALLLTITLLWWQRGQLTWLEVVVFTTIVVGILRLTRNPPLSQVVPSIKAIQNSVFALVAVALSFTTTPLNDQTLLVAWHHWSAYIGPSELLLAGARIFVDFPAQYGLGPTLLIASVCRHTCWEGMYYLVGCATTLFAILIAYLALDISNKVDNRRNLPRWLVLILVIVCCFFWAGYPAQVSLPMSTPSAGGLRFVPALALVALLIRIDHLLQNVNHYVYFGHLGWSLAALWSPESGFYATCVWWPYFLLLRTSKSNNHRDFLVNLYKALAALLLVAFVLVALFATAFWLVYRTPPSGSAFFAYALNPPGHLSIDANGAIWFFIVFVILASLHNWQMFRQSGNTMLFRRGLILLLFTYSTFSYFVGRSHDNNILNIVPFMLLVLLHIFSTAVDRSLRMIATTLLAALLGWSSSFSWDAWFLPSGKLNDIEFNSSWISAVIFDAKVHQLRAVHAPFADDTARALSETQRDTQEAVTVVSSWNGLASTNAEAVWSAFHGPANIVLFPSAMRRRFLSHTAGTLKRSGWLIFPQSELRGALIADFDSVYSRKEVRNFGTVLAIRYAPK